MAINADWHTKNRMPKNPTAKQRLTWHVEHAKHCDCRKLTAEMLEKLQREAEKK